MAGRWKSFTAGLDDGTRRFFKHEETSFRWQASKIGLSSKGEFARSKLDKSKIVAALALHIAKRASPLGLAHNTYVSIKEGANSYNYVRRQEWEEAMADLVEPFDPSVQDAIRNIVLNPNVPAYAEVVLPPGALANLEEMIQF